MGGQRVTAREPCGVYVHFPFCRSRCGYCDFDSVATRAIPDRDYTEAVLAELEARAAPYQVRELLAIYLGGGTPSLWRPPSLERVLTRILERFSPALTPEVTIELNPGPPEQPWREAELEALLRAGVNRLSVGVQSLDDRFLQLLGRIHDARSARETVRRARAAGFSNISCDLILGLPGQRQEHHRCQVSALLELEPDHVSAYALTLAPTAPLRRAGLSPAPDDRVAEMLEEGRAQLAEAGFEHYEVSNFARPGRRSVHNSLVWAGHPYLGLGAAAHSMWPLGPSTVRIANPGLEDYLKRPHDVEGQPPRLARAGVEQLDPPRSCFEILLLGLRTTDGVDRAAYRARFGADITSHFGPPLDELQRRGLITVTPASIAPTPRGIWFCDETALSLCP